MTSPNSTPAIPGWKHIYSGKVRDLYEPVNPLDNSLLVVASDRVSAFDTVLEPGIPHKGSLLTELSRWWFGQLSDFPNHLRDTAPPQEVADRAMVTVKLNMYPIECVVRGYLTGSGWAEYQRTQSVCGVPLPSGLTDGDRLPEPIYTPAYKAPLGAHDENISFEQSVQLVGPNVAAALRDSSLAIFSRASELAYSRGIILADTKFEFGAHPATGILTLGDEVLTSDSSRYWDAETYRSGATLRERLASFDKQIVRDWISTHWDGTGEAPPLPDTIVQQTEERYRELLARLITY
ncbi:phosphoribosylaminoimidazolesuccinocarboxamide synthase [Lysinibacter sp. HNR]|uniref:phosphoribosylaminoimidazolesuccinocarboxamide synthase n=1 Tax=Lysinibacter sp. HNR TaxID=3031408 RepID=UPI0024355E92|nr:phosphoribosylaminoimidazolesuccinocarboxamide synthase [Lysinibacter sp. HNR]WGD37723.1 phosphoribosylaminoimidazolesuccinocarboxamide synthase [Lysinibacter sp. HNR]